MRMSTWRVLGALAVFALAAAPSAAQPNVAVDLDDGTAGIQSTRTVAPDETFTAAIWVLGVTDLSGFNIALTWDSNLLTANSATEGPFLESLGGTGFFPPVTIGAGQLEAAGSILAPTEANSPDGDGVIYTVEFQASDTNTGDTPVEFSTQVGAGTLLAVLVGGTSEFVTPGFQNATLTVQLGPSPPQNLAVQDKPNDQGGAIQGTFDKSPDDDGAGGVTEYRVYKEEQTGLGTKAFAQFLTIPADGSANYAFEDLNASKTNDTCYRVTAFDGTNEGGASNTDCARGVDNIPPGAPSNVVATDKPNDQGKNVLVDFDASADDGGGVDDVAEYRIYRDGDPTPVGTVAADDSAHYQFEDTVPTVGQEYCYVVRAFDGENESADSNQDCATTVDDTAPGEPQNVAADDHPGDQGDALDVTWDASADDGQNADDVTEYRVYRELGEEATKQPALVHTEPATDAATYTWTDTGLTKGVEYCYIVRAFDGTQESVDSPQVCGFPRDNTPPAPPTNVQAADHPGDQGDALDVTWDASSDDGGGAGDVIQYAVLREQQGTTGTKAYTLVHNEPATGAATYAWTDDTVTKNEEYCYIVRAFDGTLESGDSNEDCATAIDNIPPSPPENVDAQDVAPDQGGSIKVTWDPSPDDPNSVDTKPTAVDFDVVSYQVYRDGQPVGDPIPIATSTKQPLYQFIDDTVPDKTQEHCYTVRANDGTNESADSNEDCATATDDIPPAAPLNLRAEDHPGDQGNVIDITWEASADDGIGADDVDEYRIFREEQGGASGKAFTQIGTVPSVEVPQEYTFEDTNATTGTEFCYFVRAFDGTNESADSNQDCATSAINIPADPPHNLVAQDTPNDEGGSNTLTWDRSADDGAGANTVTEYRVYRKSGGGAFILVAAVPATGQANYTHDDTGLTDGVAYTYEVRSWNESAEAASNQDTATPIDNLPPGPPQNVAAQDVAPDQGGSILVTWDPSPNDPNAGGGSTKGDGNPLDVVSYQVYRDGAPVGDPVPVATGAKNGVSYQFTDQQVPDKTEQHCYIVRAYDGTQESSDSNEDCATATDDIAPGAPQNLRAGDMTRAAGDRRVALKWDRSADDGQGADDVTEYHVYREDLGPLGAKAFVQVMVVPATGAVTYNVNDTDAALQPATQYAYLVRAFDGANESADSNQHGPVVPTETPLFTHTFLDGAGLQLVTIPATPVGPDPGALKVTDIYQVPNDGNHVWRWDPSGSPPYITDPTNPFMDVAQGRGHWVRFDADTNVSVNGIAVPDDQPFVWDEFEEGWNMAGNPRTVPLDWLDVEPNPAGSADDFGWIYDPTIGAYRLVAEFPALNAVNQVPPYAGFWIRGYANADQLTFAAVGGVATKGRAIEPQKDVKWQLPVVVSGGGVQDVCNAVGVADRAVAVADPPTTPRYVTAYFVNDAAGGQRLAYDLRPDDTRAWDMVVRTNLPDTDITVALPDLSQVPRDRDVILRDLDADQVVHVRTQRTYTYNSGKQAGERRFRLEVVPQAGGGLTITGLQIAPTRGGSVSVRYDVSQAAAVTTTVLNIAGRVVATLERDRAVARGSVVSTWDLRNDAGARVPDGAYLVRIEARADSGQRTSGVARVVVAR